MANPFLWFKKQLAEFMGQAKDKRLAIEEQGREAFRAGLKESDCPFLPKNKNGIRDDRRMWWFAGWLDERSRSRLSNVFAKYPDDQE